MTDTIHIWFLPVLGSALMLGSYDICRKEAVRENSVMPVLFFASLSGTIFFTLISLITGKAGLYFAAGSTLFFPVLLKALIVGVSWIFGYYAMRELPISIAAPIRATAPLWTFLGGLLLYNEVPTLLQGAAMFLIFTGYYCFSVFGKLEGISFSRNKGILYVFLGTIFGAGSALYDKYLLGVLKLPHDAMQFWFSVDLLFVLGSAWMIRSLFGHSHKFRWSWAIPATGVLLICADFLYFYALGLPDTRISLVSLVRRSSCIVTFVIGSLWFHEANKRKKGIALLIVLAGVILLALAK